MWHKHEQVLASRWYAHQTLGVRELLRTHPPHAFYQLRDSWLPVRIYGVGKRANSHKHVLLGVVAHSHTVETIEHGLDPETIEEAVGGWCEAQLCIINSLPVAWHGVFIEADGALKLTKKQ